MSSVSTRSLLTVAAALFVLGLTLVAHGQGLRRGGGLGPQPVTYGTPFKYNSQYPTRYVRSDVFANTWADDDQIYVVNDDSYGWNNAAPTSNLQVSKFSAPDTTLTGTNVNVMAAFGTLGQGGSDGSNVTWKANGIISVSGTLYVHVSRQMYGNTAAPWIQTAFNAQIIKSGFQDHGATWTPLPSTGQPYATPMFSGGVNAAMGFIHYGKDYVGQTADNSNLYVYGTSNEGCWNNCSKLFLGRVLITDLPDVTAATGAAKWSYWQGGSSWGAWATAQPLLDSPYHIGGLSSVWYVPNLKGGIYMYINWYYPGPPVSLDPDVSVWEFYTAPHPWGPYTMQGPAKIWNKDPGLGLYSPHIISKSLVVAGNTATMNIVTAGSYNHQESDPGAGPATYTLTIVPVTVVLP